MASRGWLLVGGVGLVVLFFAGTQVWVSGRIPQVTLGVVDIEATGTQVSQLVTAAALMAGAGLLGGLVGSRPVRLMAGLVLIGAGVLAGAAVVDTIDDPAAAVRQIVAERTGVTGAEIDPEHTLAATGWPWAAATGALCLLGSGALRWWSPLTAGDRDRQRRISAERGTRSDAGGRSPAASASPDQAGAAAGPIEDAIDDDEHEPAPTRARPREAADADLWRRLSEGEDPTAAEPGEQGPDDEGDVESTPTSDPDHPGR